MKLSRATRRGPAWHFLSKIYINVSYIQAHRMFVLQVSAAHQVTFPIKKQLMEQERQSTGLFYPHFLFVSLFKLYMSTHPINDHFVVCGYTSNFSIRISGSFYFYSANFKRESVMKVYSYPRVVQFITILLYPQPVKLLYYELSKA